LIGILGAAVNKNIKFSSYIISTETMQMIVMAIILIIAGDYLQSNSVNKEEV